MESNQKQLSTETAARLVNWDFAAATAATLVAPGPKMTRREIQAAVEDLRRLADEAVTHVHRITGLDAAEDRKSVV